MTDIINNINDCFKENTNHTLKNIDLEHLNPATKITDAIQSIIQILQTPSKAPNFEAYLNSPIIPLDKKKSTVQYLIECCALLQIRLNDNTHISEKISALIDNNSNFSLFTQQRTNQSRILRTAGAATGIVGMTIGLGVVTMPVGLVLLMASGTLVTAANNRHSAETLKEELKSAFHNSLKKRLNNPENNEISLHPQASYYWKKLIIDTISNIEQCDTLYPSYWQIHFYRELFDNKASLGKYMNAQRNIKNPVYNKTGGSRKPIPEKIRNAENQLIQDFLSANSSIEIDPRIKDILIPAPALSIINNNPSEAAALNDNSSENNSPSETDVLIETKPTTSKNSRSFSNFFGSSTTHKTRQNTDAEIELNKRVSSRSGPGFNQNTEN